MIRSKDPARETQYRPQAGNTLRAALIQRIRREFPRLGGPWVLALFVDKVLQLVDAYQIAGERLSPGQTLWPAIAVDEQPGDRKPTRAMRQVPVVLTLVNQEDIADLRHGVKWTTILQRSLVRAAQEAYAQGGVLTTADLSGLFHHGLSRVAELIRAYETETGETMPRRGNLHDIGRTVSHKRIICRKAYLEGKPTHMIARETCHSPWAVDQYVLDCTRVYFATVQCGMSVEETGFAIQRPRYLVEEDVRMIVEFGVSNQRVKDGVERALDTGKLQLNRCDTHTEPTDERRAQPTDAD